MFQPDTEYDVLPTSIDVKDFHEYPQLFVTRPPYQRKNVWSSKKQQSLLDSLFRRYYIPRLVLREVRIRPAEVLREAVDGQQRITTVQRFFAGELCSASNCHRMVPRRRPWLGISALGRTMKR
jgi:hypothetical protein